LWSPLCREAYNQTHMQSERQQVSWAALSPARSWMGYTPTLEWWSEFRELMALSSAQLLAFCGGSICTAHAIFSRRFPIVKCENAPRPPLPAVHAASCGTPERFKIHRED
jgi:hypothetical protein